ncbi:MAG: 16S rRNA methyltransferase [Alphaproteobacteria bacterium]|nr:16S rRNA methyltransferase [Alphaproteobacteria bacterium]
MVNSDRIDRLIADVAPAMAMRAGMELDLFTLLGRGPASARELAATLEVDPERLSRLLYALASIGLLEVEAGEFRNSAEAAAFLDAAQPAYRGSDHALLRELWGADLLTADSLRQNRPAALHDFADPDPAAAAAFCRKLAPGGVIFGRLLAEAMDLSGIGSVIDIGGGAGTILAGLRERWPHLATTLMELPAVAAVAPEILAEHGAPDVAVEEGDITLAPSRGRHDLAILKAVVQVMPPNQARSAILNAARSLNAGGEIAVAGWGVVDDDRLGPPEGVFLNLTFLNLYRAGESYTEGQYRSWMTEAGFVGIVRTRLADGCTLFRARLAP